jgi:hypothetical protein
LFCAVFLLLYWEFLAIFVLSTFYHLIPGIFTGSSSSFKSIDTF